MEHICVFYQYKMKAHSNNEPMIVKKLSLEDEIKTRISKIGINEDMIGKKYTIDSISIVAKSNNPDINLHRDVFPLIAKKYSKSIGSVNRAIETAINKAWSITDEETLAECYPPVVSGSKGTPTNKEFIFYFAYQIKDVYKA